MPLYEMAKWHRPLESHNNFAFCQDIAEYLHSSRNMVETVFYEDVLEFLHIYFSHLELVLNQRYMLLFDCFKIIFRKSRSEN